MGELDVTLENSRNGFLEVSNENDFDLVLDGDGPINLVMDSGGGGSGYYNALIGLPSINGVTLKGSLTSADLYLSKESINTKDYWNSNPLYVPQAGEIVIYTDRQIIDGVKHPGIKIGDGSAYLIDLPFVGDSLHHQITEAIDEHINNSNVHVSLVEKQFWNDKLNCEVENSNLVFNRM